MSGAIASAVLWQDLESVQPCQRRRGQSKGLGSPTSIVEMPKESKQSIHFIFFLNVNKETIIKRIEKRKILEKRSDDDLETILKRYDTYIETTRPVMNYYSKNSNFHEIDGSLEIDQITAKIEAFLNV